MYLTILLATALLLSEMVGVDFTPLLVAGLLVLVMIALVSWWGGLRLVRSSKKALLFAGVVVLIVALASSIKAIQFLRMLVGNSLQGITPVAAILLLLVLTTPFSWWGAYRLTIRHEQVSRPIVRILLLTHAFVGSALTIGAIALWAGNSR